MRRVLALLLTAPLLLLVSAPAQADGGGGSWGPEGYLIKHAPDTGYDDPMLVRCANGLSYLIAEGHASTQASPAKPDCDGVVQVYVRKNEEWWCWRATETFKKHLVKWRDKTGWSTIKRGCNGVLRRD